MIAAWNSELHSNHSLHVSTPPIIDLHKTICADSIIYIHVELIQYYILIFYACLLCYFSYCILNHHALCISHQLLNSYDVKYKLAFVLKVQYGSSLVAPPLQSYQQPSMAPHESNWWSCQLHQLLLFKLSLKRQNFSPVAIC